MKKNRIIFIVLFLLLGLAGSLSAQQNLINGTVKQRDGEGRLRAILKYKQGHLIRKMLYHENGQLILDTVYRNGVPVQIKTYNLDGSIKSSWSQKDGTKNYYHPAG